MLNWIRHKYNQISSLVNDEELAFALTSPIREPIEGARFQVGDQIHAKTVSGNCRHFQVCGVQSGGFSNVYSVIDKTEMKAYCIKGNRSLPEDEETQNQKLKQEALVWMKLGEHPNLVSAHSAFYINDQLHILIEYISGDNLSALRKSGRLDLPNTLKYAVHLCRAMIHAGKVFPGFVHGDIKPGNCLITKEGILKLTDFGMAFAGNDPAEDMSGGLESAGSLENDLAINSVEKRGGTYAYMAPEKFDPNQSITTSTDIYGFGITLFEILAGQKPFKGPEREDFCNQHKFQEPPAKMLEQKVVPSEMIDLILKCLAKIPEERIESFEIIEEQISKIYCQETGSEISSGAKTIATVSDRMSRGIAFAELGDLESSKVYFDQAFKIEPRSAEIWSQKALAQILAKNFVQADIFSAKAISYDWYSPTVLLSRAKVLDLRGQKTDALLCLDKILQDHPKNFQALNLKGKIKFHLKCFKEAAECFEKCISYDDFHAEPFKGLAEIYLKTKEFEKALYYSKKALAINNNNAKILKILGDSYYYLKFYEKAIGSYKRSIELGINKDQIRLPFVKSCGKFFKLKMGYLDRSILETLWRSVNSMENLNPKFAKDIFSLLRLEKYNPLLLYYFDDFIYLSLRRADKKLKREFIDILWKVFDECGSAFLQFNPFYSIGKLFYLYERFDDCLQVFNHSLKQGKGDENTYYYLAACYEMKEELELSLYFYDKALEINNGCELNRTGKRRIESRLKENRGKKLKV